MANDCFRTREICEGVFQISDVLDDRAYLVVGERSAVLVDTGMGYGCMRDVVRDVIGNLPVRVLLTHSHYDHVGGAYFFDEVWMGAADADQWDYEAGLAREVYPQHVRAGTFCEDVPFGPRDGHVPAVNHVREGDTFDLGALTVEAVALPAHTPGSMGYAVRERRVLLSGDAVTPIMCLFFPRSMGIEAHRRTLAKMARLPFDVLYTGHHEPGFPREALAGFDEVATFAQTHRGYPWRHALLPSFTGTVYLPPCATTDVDSPDFRALIGP